MSTPASLKAVGLLRTGTNFAIHSISANYHVDRAGPEDFGWKHGPLDPEPEVKYVVMVKHPMSWVVSFMDWETIHKRLEPCTIEQFVASKITHQRLSNAWQTDDVMEAWNRSVRWWTDRRAKNVLLIRYEDLNTQFTSTMEKIARHFDLWQTASTLKRPSQRVDTWRTPLARPDRPVGYYSEALYLSRLSHRATATIVERTDDELARQLGYLPSGGSSRAHDDLDSCISASTGSW